MVFQIPNNEPWMEQSKCGTDPHLLEWQKANREEQFFDEFSVKGSPILIKEHKDRAKRYCAGCPVRTECLSYALANDEQGIWAGTTERQRNSMKKNARKAALAWLARQQVQLPDEQLPNVS